MNPTLERTKAGLEKNGFDVSVFATAAEAADYIAGSLDGETVGFGGSVTLQQLGLFEKLSERNRVLWHWRCAEGATPAATRDEAAVCGVYISSVNGISESGEIVNIDGTGNRVAAMLYGHRKVILVAGVNKIAPDLDGAIWRARNIASPKNAQRLGVKTPCAAKGDRCYDCDCPARICNALNVLWKKPGGSEYEVVLIDEELGY